MFKGKKCPRCEGKVKSSFDFCPVCGLDLRNPEKDQKDFGMLGKNNHVQGLPLTGGFGGLGITDKMINSVLKSLMRSLEQQFQSTSEDSEVESFPNGIKIKINPPKNQGTKKVVKKKAITQEQIDRMSGMPREEAKSSIRRLSDRVIYELKASGIESVEDVFVSKLESGYEVKAIGKKKVYVNSLPVNLPLRGYSINDKGLNVEFSLQ